jgi:Mg2+ and Co2+ transporter CorA
MELSRGDAFVEFLDSLYDSGQVSHADAVRIINGQAETINDSLLTQMRTTNHRRQSLVYLLEQCIILSSSNMFAPSGSSNSLRRFRKLRRLVERARRLVRGA